MTFMEASNGGVCAGCVWFAAEGEITRDTPDDFREWAGERFAGGADGPTLVLNSPGGHLLAGLELGRLIREMGFAVRIGATVPEPDGGYASRVVEGQCLSACAYAFLGGRSRSLGSDTELGFHQFFSQDWLTRSEERSFSGGDRLKDQYVIGLIVSYLVEMDVSAEVYSIAAGAGPGSFAFISQEDANRLRIAEDPKAMSPWEIVPLGDGVMVESRSVDAQKGIRLFCLRREPGRVHVQVMNRSPDGSDRLENSYGFGTPDEYFYDHVSTFEAEIGMWGSGERAPLAMQFNRILSEPDSGYHVNFDFTIADRDLWRFVGRDHLYFWPGHGNVLTVNFWGQFVASRFPGNMTGDMAALILENCV